ncbi:MAG: hypothetical protein LBI77_01335 [Puniceicoccales bacterium]|jgi:hypothetical protein|nr:hypothetical protein [Puniceicoccales bacterium]
MKSKIVIFHSIPEANSFWKKFSFSQTRLLSLPKPVEIFSWFWLKEVKAFVTPCRRRTAFCKQATESRGKPREFTLSSAFHPIA